MILEMVAWRDPNMVPIAAFYGDDLKVNFCGKLASDPHTQVGCCGCAGLVCALLGPWRCFCLVLFGHDDGLLLWHID